MSNGLIDFMTSIVEFGDMLKSDKDFSMSPEVKRIFKNLCEDFDSIYEFANKYIENYFLAMDGE